MDIRFMIQYSGVSHSLRGLVSYERRTLPVSCCPTEVNMMTYHSSSQSEYVIPILVDLGTKY